jgi:hypothetical protein
MYTPAHVRANFVVFGCILRHCHSDIPPGKNRYFRFLHKNEAAGAAVASVVAAGRVWWWG